MKIFLGSLLFNDKMLEGINAKLDDFSSTIKE
jgi:hypothetical protein